MKLITLLTDFGDYYPGVMKGVILSLTRQKIQIIDISHSVEPQNILQGAFLLYSSYRYFKKGTVHVAVVDPGVGSERAAVVVETSNYIFVSPDNGLIYAAAFEDGIKTVYEINSSISELVGELSTTFHGRDIFAPASALIVSGEWQKSGYFKKRSKKEIKKMEIFSYRIDGNLCLCKAVYVDKFGNVVTNLRAELVKKLRPKSFYCCGVEFPFVRRYSDVEIGKPLALVGSFNTLELSVREGNAAKLIGIQKGNVELEMEVVR
jgi:hypothetical protein